jgi:glycosyltransferase involved in cell wall biosynthesis
MKNILYVEQTVDGTIGGSHYCLLYLIQHLNKYVFKPKVVFYEDNKLVDRFRQEAEVFIFNKINFNLFRYRIIRSFLNFIKNIKFIIICYIFIKKNKIDLVHLNNTVAAGYDTWLIASILARIPCVTHDRTFLKFNKLDLKGFKILSKKFNKVLTVSNTIRKNLLDQGFDPSIVETVYDGIDADEYRRRIKRKKADILDEFKIGSDNYLIGLVGNIRQWKGQQYLIDTLNIVNNEIQNFFCLLIGDTAKNYQADIEYKKKLEEKIDKYGLKNKVIFTGYRDDVPDLCSALDVQINPSIKPDPFPHVILEAMSLGNPVIATDLGGARESIEEGKTGFLISSDNVHDFAAKLKRILLDSELREMMSKNAKGRVEIFSIENNVKNTEQIYKKLLFNT